MMKTKTAWLTLAALGGLAGVTFAVPASWPQALGLDFWNLPRLQQELDRQQERLAELDKRGDWMVWRTQHKETVIDDLVDGQIGLREAADQFLLSNRRWPPTLHQLRLHFRGATDSERSVRQVMTFVEARLGDDTRVTPELVEKLRCEMSQTGQPGWEAR